MRDVHDLLCINVDKCFGVLENVSKTPTAHIKKVRARPTTKLHVVTYLVFDCPFLLYVFAHAHGGVSVVAVALVAVAART